MPAPQTETTPTAIQPREDVLKVLGWSQDDAKEILGTNSTEEQIGDFQDQGKRLYVDAKTNGVFTIGFSNGNLETPKIEEPYAIFSALKDISKEGGENSPPLGEVKEILTGVADQALAIDSDFKLAVACLDFAADGHIDQKPEFIEKLKSAARSKEEKKSLYFEIGKVLNKENQTQTEPPVTAPIETPASDSLPQVNNPTDALVIPAAEATTAAPTNTPDLGVNLGTATTPGTPGEAAQEQAGTSTPPETAIPTPHFPDIPMEVGGNTASTNLINPLTGRSEGAAPSSLPKIDETSQLAGAFAQSQKEEATATVTAAIVPETTPTLGASLGETAGTPDISLPPPALGLDNHPPTPILGSQDVTTNPDASAVVEATAPETIAPDALPNNITRFPTPDSSLTPAPPNPNSVTNTDTASILPPINTLGTENQGRGFHLPWSKPKDKAA